MLGSCNLSSLSGCSSHCRYEKVFQAKSARLLNKIVRPSSAPSLIERVHKTGQAPVAVDESPLKIQPQPTPKSGPPPAWLRSHGRTAGCDACDNRVLRGRVHSVKRKQRYLDWCQSVSSCEPTPDLDKSKAKRDLKADSREEDEMLRPPMPDFDPDGY